jgi:hypothetical protein
MQSPDMHHDELQIDPEPVSLMLTMLGAVGSVASVYALFQNRREPTRPERQMQVNAIRDALMGAETALNEIRAQVRSLEIAFETGTSSRGNRERARLQLAQFGRVSLLFTADGHHTWRELEQNSLGTVSRLHKHMSDIMRLFATAPIMMPNDIANQLERVVGELNALLSRLAQIHFDDLFRSLEEITHLAMGCTRELRQRLDELVR